MGGRKGEGKKGRKKGCRGVSISISKVDIPKYILSQQSIQSLIRDGKSNHGSRTKLQILQTKPPSLHNLTQPNPSYSNLPPPPGIQTPHPPLPSPPPFPPHFPPPFTNPFIPSPTFPTGPVSPLSTRFTPSLLDASPTPPSSPLLLNCPPTPSATPPWTAFTLSSPEMFVLSFSVSGAMY